MTHHGQVRLGDMDLLIEVERDFTVYGDECKFGGGKVLREGMGQAALVSNDVALDTVITNALIVDAVTGIVKADVGIKVGCIPSWLPYAYEPIMPSSLYHCRVIFSTLQPPTPNQDNTVYK